MSGPRIGGQDWLQWQIDRAQEDEDLQAWREREFDRHCAAERAKADGPTFLKEFGVANAFGEVIE